MSHISRMEYLAAKDAYLTRLLLIIDCMIEDQENYTDTKTPPPKSEASVRESPAPDEDLGDSLAGTLNANLHPCMLPFEDFVSDVRHISHPYCD